MHLDTSPPNAAVSTDAETDEDLLAAFGGPDLISDDEIDYADIAHRTQPGQPGGEIVFDSADYATHEEAMAALEALFLHDVMRADDEAAPNDQAVG
jgi:hypothetical protein